jgi:hypothetical protein
MLLSEAGARPDEISTSKDRANFPYPLLQAGRGRNHNLQRLTFSAGFSLSHDCGVDKEL